MEQSILQCDYKVMKQFLSNSALGLNWFCLVWSSKEMF